MIVPVTPAREAGVRTFLQAHLSTSVFLLYCLERFGPALGDHRDSGNFRCVLEGDRVVAVACSTRRGHLLVQTGGRDDLGTQLWQAFDGDPVRIDGVVGEWTAAQSVWPLARDRRGFLPIYEIRHVTYEMQLDAGMTATRRRPEVRILEPDDFDVWYPLFHALELQEGVQIQGNREQVRAGFGNAAQRWWGAFEGPELAAVACLDVSAAGAGHVGGIYVDPNRRRKGLARTILEAIVVDSQATLNLSVLVLLTREDNLSARRLYEGMGFVATGTHFGFLLGEWI
jgi:ribosomal protein S18 acetylase RimI-like enzyme